MVAVGASTGAEFEAGMDLMSPCEVWFVGDEGAAAKICYRIQLVSLMSFG